MSPPRRSSPALRRFFLAAGGPPFQLDPGEARHATRVVRIGIGDTLLGLDGRGLEHRLQVTGIQGERVELESDGSEPRTEPEPRPLEIAFSLPKGSRGEDALNMLVQLGTARVVPLVCARSEGAARGWSDNRRQRFERIAREACKQSGRLWLPTIGEPRGLSEWLDGAGDRAFLDARGEETLGAWLARHAQDTQDAQETQNAQGMIRLAIGPEGGFDEDELTFMAAEGATRLALSPHVLRTETAAVAAATVVLCGSLR